MIYREQRGLIATLTFGYTLSPPLRLLLSTAAAEAGFYFSFPSLEFRVCKALVTFGRGHGERGKLRWELEASAAGKENSQ